METLAGDTTVGHATAYCQARGARQVAAFRRRAHALRAIAPRAGAAGQPHRRAWARWPNDVGFLPTASYCGRLRGDFLNLTAMLCGSRFGRGLVRPGGVGFDLDEDRARQLGDRLEAALRDVTNAVKLLWDSASVQARFEETGVVT